jgi:dephospho-CoA kinase
MGDVTILVEAPVDIRMERAAARNGVSRETICKRMESQLYMNDISNGTVECPADFLVTNSGTLSQLEKKMDKLVEIILKQKCYHTKHLC